MGGGSDDAAKKVFRLPAYYRSVGWFATAFFGAGALLYLSLPWLFPDGARGLSVAIVGVPVTGALALVGVMLVRVSRYRVEVDGSGITQIGPGRKRIRLEWDEMDDMLALPFFRQRLELRDRAGRRTVRLEYQLLGFERLVDHVYEKWFLPRARPVTPADLPVTFHFHQTNELPMLLAGTFCGLLAALCLVFYLRYEGGPAALGCAILLAAFFLVFVPHALSIWHVRLRLEEDGFVLRYLLRTRRWSYEQIMDIALASDGSCLDVSLAGWQSLRLWQTREGVFAMHHALVSIWREKNPPPEGGPEGPDKRS